MTNRVRGPVDLANLVPVVTGTTPQPGQLALVVTRPSGTVTRHAVTRTDDPDPARTLTRALARATPTGDRVTVIAYGPWPGHGPSWPTIPTGWVHERLIVAHGRVWCATPDCECDLDAQLRVAS